MEIILGLYLIFFIGTVWFLICNSRTFKQRMRIIDWAHEDNHSWRQRSKCLDQVSYQQHLWCLFRFGDPKKLYDFSDCE